MSRQNEAGSARANVLRAFSLRWRIKRPAGDERVRDAEATFCPLGQLATFVKCRSRRGSFPSPALFGPHPSRPVSAPTHPTRARKDCAAWVWNSLARPGFQKEAPESQMARPSTPQIPLLNCHRAQQDDRRQPIQSLTRLFSRPTPTPTSEPRGGPATLPSPSTSTMRHPGTARPHPTRRSTAHCARSTGWPSRSRRRRSDLTGTGPVGAGSSAACLNAAGARRRPRSTTAQGNEWRMLTGGIGKQSMACSSAKCCSESGTRSLTSACGIAE